MVSIAVLATSMKLDIFSVDVFTPSPKSFTAVVALRALEFIALNPALIVDILADNGPSFSLRSETFAANLPIVSSSRLSVTLSSLDIAFTIVLSPPDFNDDNGATASTTPRICGATLSRLIFPNDFNAVGSFARLFDKPETVPTPFNFSIEFASVRSEFDA